MKWASDNPDLFAMMEKTRMYIFRWVRKFTFFKIDFILGIFSRRNSLPGEMSLRAWRFAPYVLIGSRH